MAFRIHDVTVQLMPPNPQQDPPRCTMITGDTGEKPWPCEESTHAPCQERTNKPRPGPGGGPGGPGGNRPAEGEKKQALGFLQARLRQTLAAPAR